MNPLQHPDYIRERLEPRPGDCFYIHLADLRAAIELVRSVPAERILDYGCGGSPYRSLFTAQTYHRADLLGSPDIDYGFGPDSRLALPDCSYDLVLSTQVLEHVGNVPAYLAEAFRLVRPGGKLVLTTHGTFCDHGCPHDYFRWTPYGLRDAIANAGFKVTELKKLSAGPRALLFLLGLHRDELKLRGWSAAAIQLRLLRRTFAKAQSTMDRLADLAFSRHAVVPATEATSPLYVGIMAVAERPA